MLLKFIKRRKGNMEVRKQKMPCLSVSCWVPRKWTVSVIGVDWGAELSESCLPHDWGWYPGLMWMRVTFSLLSPFLVYQEPLLASLGIAVCALGRSSPLPSQVTILAWNISQVCCHVWNEIRTGGGPVSTSQDALGINHVAHRQSCDFRVLMICERHVMVSGGGFTSISWAKSYQSPGHSQIMRTAPGHRLWAYLSLCSSLPELSFLPLTVWLIGLWSSCPPRLCSYMGLHLFGGCSRLNWGLLICVCCLF